MKERRYPRLNENTRGHLEIYGWAENGKNYYEVKNVIDESGKVSQILEWTNLRTGDAWSWEYKE